MCNVLSRKTDIYEKYLLLMNLFLLQVLAVDFLKPKSFYSPREIHEDGFNDRWETPALSDWGMCTDLLALALR